MHVKHGREGRETGIHVEEGGQLQRDLGYCTKNPQYLGLCCIKKCSLRRSHRFFVVCACISLRVCARERPVRCVSVSPGLCLKLAQLICTSRQHSLHQRRVRETPVTSQRDTSLTDTSSRLNDSPVRCRNLPVLSRPKPLACSPQTRLNAIISVIVIISL